jgi:hypothetical protein
VSYPLLLLRQTVIHNTNLKIIDGKSMKTTHEVLQAYLPSTFHLLLLRNR